LPIQEWLDPSDTVKIKNNQKKKLFFF